MRHFSFALALAMFASAAVAVAQTAPGSIGYSSVAAALEGLRTKPGANVAVQGGWTIVEEGTTLWSFTPASHPAHPAVIKRTIVQRDGTFFVDMSALCEAPNRLVTAWSASSRRSTSR